MYAIMHLKMQFLLLFVVYFFRLYIYIYIHELLINQGLLIKLRDRT